MNKQVRLLLGALTLLSPRIITASLLFNKKPSLFDLVKLPVQAAVNPQKITSNLLLYATAAQQQETTTEELHILPLMQRQSGMQVITETGTVPTIIEQALTKIPHNNEAPVYINVNMSNQQTATTAPLQPNKDFLPRGTSEKKGLTKNSLDSCRILLKQLYQWITEHKITCSLATLITSISGLQLYMWHLASRLSKENCWSLWHAHSSLAQLYQIPQHELIKSLFKELEQKYKTDDPLTNCQRFISEADQELVRLSYYKELARFSNFWPLNNLLWFNNALINSATDRIARITFILNVMRGWISEHHKKYTYEQLFSSSKRLKGSRA